MQPNWPTNHSLWIPAGGRLDFLSAAMAAVQKAFPVWLPFVVQYGSNTQSARTRPAYFIYMPWHMPWQQTESIPTMVSAGDCRARTSEGLHFRCMDRACKLRGHAEVLTATPASDQAEIDEDDLEVPASSEQQDVQEDQDEAELLDAAFGVHPRPWGGGMDAWEILRGLRGGCWMRMVCLIHAEFRPMISHRR